ncbi:hypothetical protein DFP74_0008 [Nocardiopsis sp. Huas11]|uniref:hypothetical protein n=1 Tax=Nocardiopsis sp. Huas11 TaxID=2183912 RepID=UPI000F1530DA|nr:hypothetical protein [Nocardiopsis sp. Huas11]RKS04451.1 hypothetical protein DFP74_0008 [Nocardiopsis sp. Huas11]
MFVVRWATVALATALVLVLTAAAAATDPRGGELDGYAIGHLPDQIDDRTEVSDFTYEWEDVAFSTRVWERTLEGGGAQVVLQVLVLRGARLTDLSAVRAFLAEYHERSPDTWALSTFDHDGVEGLRGETEAFWCPEAGVAVEVRDAFGLLGTDELLATARGVRPE